MILRNEILMGRDRSHPLSADLEARLSKLLTAINILRTARDRPMIVTSGYRPGPFNRVKGASPRSAHMTCEAVDIADPDGTLAAWITSRLVNPGLLEQAGLWVEDPAATQGWVHFQTRPPRLPRGIRPDSRIVSPRFL